MMSAINFSHYYSPTVPMQQAMQRSPNYALAAGNHLYAHVAWLCTTLIFALLVFIMTMPANAAPPEFEMLASPAAFTPQAYKARETHAAVEVRFTGEGAKRAYLFVPSAPRPTPGSDISVVFFHHGWQGMNPMNFGSLIDHLTRTGHAVIYPVYQDNKHTPPALVTDNAGDADREALALLAAEFGLSPRAGQTLYYGFSIGAAISVNLALKPEAYGLPPADALILIAPGDAIHVDNRRWLDTIYGPVEHLPATLPIVLMTGAEDNIGLPTARKLAARLCHISREHRIFYVLPSSTHGGRKIAAGHGSPGAPDTRYNFSPKQTTIPRTLAGRPSFEPSASLNQLDYSGYWKIITGVLTGLAAAPTGSDTTGRQPRSRFPAYVFDQGSDLQLTLGTWEDGTPLAPMHIEEPCR